MHPAVTMGQPVADGPLIFFKTNMNINIEMSESGH